MILFAVLLKWQREREKSNIDQTTQQRQCVISQTTTMAGDNNYCPCGDSLVRLLHT